jgi:diguanylate cyclase (GGDEF)-like protein
VITDNFKKINDSLGHQLGDTLLIKLAERLSQLTRQKERLYRLCGDEFAILLENTKTGKSSQASIQINK